jgi:hypothetical protein
MIYKRILQIIFLIQILINCTSAYAVLALPLPDGSSVTIQPGETTKDTWARAQRMYPEAFKIQTIPNSKKYDTDYFNQCKLKAAKETSTDYALLTALQSCEYKATPKKCREHTIEKDRFGNEKGEKLVACVEQCTNANPYSKSFGECSKG